MKEITKYADETGSHFTFIQMASGLGLTSCPFTAVYAASKAYLANMCRSLNAEQDNVKFVAACPMWVSSEMTMTNKETTMFISPKRFVAELMSHSWSNTVVNPYMWHRLMELAMRYFPEQMMNRMMHKKMLATKQAIVRKLEREAK